MPVDTQKVVITGAGSGLGKALALQYAKRNATICVADINEKSGQQTVEQLMAMGCDAWFHPCDITLDADVDNLANAIQDRWGSFDVLINNAGVATGGALEYEDIEQWQWVININLLGLVRMTQRCVPLLNQPSTIINIASQAGITPIPVMGSYNASKAAVVSFSETMHLELANQSIHVCVACPSFFPTALDKSLRSKQPGIDKLVSKMLVRSEIDANQVAHSIVTQVEKKTFMILTHKSGKQAYAMKRYLPTRKYLNMLKSKTQHLLNLTGRA